MTGWEFVWFLLGGGVGAFVATFVCKLFWCRQDLMDRPRTPDEFWRDQQRAREDHNPRGGWDLAIGGGRVNAEAEATKYRREDART